MRPTVLKTVETKTGTSCAKEPEEYISSILWIRYLSGTLIANMTEKYQGHISRYWCKHGGAYCTDSHRQIQSDGGGSVAHNHAINQEEPFELGGTQKIWANLNVVSDGKCPIPWNQNKIHKWRWSLVGLTEEDKLGFGKDTGRTALGTDSISRQGSGYHWRGTPSHYQAWRRRGRVSLLSNYLTSDEHRLSTFHISWNGPYCANTTTYVQIW